MRVYVGPRGWTGLRESPGRGKSWIPDKAQKNDRFLDYQLMYRCWTKPQINWFSRIHWRNFPCLNYNDCLESFFFKYEGKGVCKCQHYVPPLTKPFNYEQRIDIPR